MADRVRSEVATPLTLRRTNKTPAFLLSTAVLLFAVLSDVQAQTPRVPALTKLQSELRAGDAVTTGGALLDKAVDPNTYIVGPGDVLLITMYGITPEPIVTEILPEGVVSLPAVGEIQLGQITLAEAKRRISEAVMLRVRDPLVGVTLARIRSFKVNVTGAVMAPGVVVASATDRVSEAIASAGGLAPKASRRNILLVRSQDTTRVDLAYFQAGGLLERNPYLNEGHLIFVPAVSDSFNKVEVYGAVNAPGVFEHRSGDRISDLLTLGFGLAVDADSSGAELVRLEPDGRTKRSLSVDLQSILQSPLSPANLVLQPDDMLFIRALSGFRTKEKATIVGQVRFPGTYPIRDGCRTVKELVAKAGGLLPDASLSEAEMFRSWRYARTDQTSFDQLVELSVDKLTDFELQYLKEVSTQRPGKVALDFDKLLTDDADEIDLELYDGDYVRIPAKSYTVIVMGRVVNPGIVQYEEGKSLNHYIQAAGGFGYKANKGDIRIIKANTGALVRADHKSVISMGDRIMVPQKRGTDVWGLIKDVGFFLANVATIYVVIDQALN